MVPFFVYKPLPGPTKYAFSVSFFSGSNLGAEKVLHPSSELTR